MFKFARDKNLSRFVEGVAFVKAALAVDDVNHLEGVEVESTLSIVHHVDVLQSVLQKNNKILKSE